MFDHLRIIGVASDKLMMATYTSTDLFFPAKELHFQSCALSANRVHCRDVVFT